MGAGDDWSWKERKGGLHRRREGSARKAENGDHFCDFCDVLILSDNHVNPGFQSP
jgi:hypothetical protein